MRGLGRAMTERKKDNGLGRNAKRQEKGKGGKKREDQKEAQRKKLYKI